MDDDQLRQRLQDAPVPDPVGGLDAARERAMGRVRHTHPVSAPSPWSRLARPLGATTLAAAMVGMFFLVRPASEDEEHLLPDEAQMQQFYDHHEAHRSAYFGQGR